MDPTQVNQNPAPAQQPVAPAGPAGELTQPQVILTPEEYQHFQSRDQAAAGYERQFQMIRGQEAARQANEAYEREKSRVMEEGDPQKMEAFFEAKRQAEHQEIRAAIVPALAEKYKGEIAQHYGLPPEQVNMLGENPDLFEQRATFLAQQNQLLQGVGNIAEQSQLAFQAQQRGLANHDRIGGMNGGGAPVQPDFEKGSIEHLRYRMYGDGQQIIPD